nr:uncharacterized protein LOC108073188 isoform X2 [Drosophila kikkawai]
MDKYLFLMEISFMLEAVDDFEVPVEITFDNGTPDPLQMRSKPIINTKGRSRAYRHLDDHTLNVTKYRGEMVDNYCCFWVYQTHPAITQTWKNMSEHPFDFNFNGLFVENKRNNTSLNP